MPAGSLAKYLRARLRSLPPKSRISPVLQRSVCGYKTTPQAQLVFCFAFVAGFTIDRHDDGAGRRKINDELAYIRFV